VQQRTTQALVRAGLDARLDDFGQLRPEDDHLKDDLVEEAAVLVEDHAFGGLQDVVEGDAEADLGEDPVGILAVDHLLQDGGPVQLQVLGLDLDRVLCVRSGCHGQQGAAKC
jgi:hypothetical protein